MVAMRLAHRSSPAVPVDPPLITDKYGNAYTEVDPWECFVLKRRDRYSPFAIFGYVIAAWVYRDGETADQVSQLAQEWHQLTEKNNDIKAPD